MGLISNSNLRFIRAEEGDKVEIFMTHIIVIEGIKQNRYRSDSSDRKNQYRQNRGRLRYEQNYRRGNFTGNARLYQDFGRQNSRAEYRGNYRNESYSRDRGRNRSRERSFSRNNNNNRRSDRSINNSRSKSGSRASKNRDRIRSC